MAIFNSFTFDGENSLDYGVYITGEAVYNAPERAVEMVSIPGKNGALALDQGRFENIEVTYPAGTFGVEQAEFAGRMRAMRNMLASRYNYVRLTDSYHPDEYRLGLYKSGLEATPVAMSSAGEFDITFNCKPQRFLTSGEEPFIVGDWEDITTETGEVVTFEGTEKTAFKSLSAEFTYDQDGTPWKAPSDEKSPYLLRRSGGGSIGHDFDAEIDKLIGGTVAWNQLVQNGNFVNADGWNSESASLSVSNNVARVTLTGNPWNCDLGRYGIALFENHKYCISLDYLLSAGFTSTRVLMLNDKNTNTNFIQIPFATQKTRFSGIFNSSITSSASNRKRILPSGDNSGYANEYFEISNFILIDLTQAFGSEIADYVYSLEQTTAGAGVAWLRSHGFLTKDYYAYNTGSLLSVKTSEHKIVGKNLMHLTLAEIKSVNTPFTWNDNVATLNGLTYTVNINADGFVESIKVDGTATANTNFRFNGYFSLPKGNYVLSGGTNTHNNDFNITNMKTGDVWNGSTASTGSLSLTVNENDTIRQYLYIKSGYAVSNVVLYPMIRFSDTSDATYEPYHINSYPLDSDLELRGLLKLDANNNLYYDGDAYESSGSVTRKYGIVDLGTLNWWYDENNTRFKFSPVPNAKNILSWNAIGLVIAQGYTIDTVLSGGSNNMVVGMYGADIYARNTAYTDAASFKTAMSGVYLVYELATPTTEQADPYANPQIVNPLGTEEYVDTRDVPVPVGHETRYHVESDIIGRTEVNVYVGPTEDESDATVYNEGLGRTVYGGYVDLISGVLTADMGYIASYNGETIASPWVSSLEPYASVTTPSVGAQVVYPITPVTYQLTPQDVEVLLGTNYVWSDGESVTIEYGERPNSIINPTPFDSQPLVKVTGAGVLGIGDYIVTITGDADQVIYIDCESMEIYKNTGGIITPASSLVSFATNEFPVLPEGKTTITMGTGITGCEIIPRWWII